MLNLYDEKAKDRTIRYLKEKREKLGLNLPIGTKETWKAHAASKGMSITELIIQLVEQDMKNEKNK